VFIEKSCVRYWLCVGGYPRLQRCAAGLAVNPTSLKCELASTVPGCEPPPTTAPAEEENSEGSGNGNGNGAANGAAGQGGGNQPLSLGGGGGSGSVEQGNGQAQGTLNRPVQSFPNQFRGQPQGNGNGRLVG